MAVVPVANFFLAKHPRALNKVQDMQTRSIQQKTVRLFRTFLATFSAVLLASTCLQLNAQEPGRPQLQEDPGKAIVFKPSPTPERDLLNSSLSPDGKMRAEYSKGKIRITSVSDEKVLYEFSTPERAVSPTFSPDQKTIAYAIWPGNLDAMSDIYLRELETGTQTKIEGCLGTVMRLAFSGDGKRLASVAFYGPITEVVAKQQNKPAQHGELIVFDVSTQANLLSMPLVFPERLTTKNGEELFPHLPMHIALDQDGSTLVLASPAGLIRVIDVEKAENKISMELSEFARRKE